MKREGCVCERVSYCERVSVCVLRNTLTLTLSANVYNTVTLFDITNVKNA